MEKIDGIEWDKDGESFWIYLLGKDDDTVVKRGKVLVRIDISSMVWAEAHKIGSARDDPNIEPYLPPPIGRLHFSINPCDMYKQLVPPGLRKAIFKWFCIITSSLLCVLILYYLVPVVFGNLIAQAITKGL